MTGARAVRVRVPASSANLGPGFDAFGLALSLHDEVEVSVTTAGLSVEVVGEGAATVSRDETHLVVVALRAAFDALGGQPAGLTLRCANRIPHGRGLGSSAAAIVAGVRAAVALRPGEIDALAVATALEGHPDNVAACLLGGVTVAWTGPDGVTATRLEPAPSLAPVAFVPPTTSSTAEVRGLLPALVPHADAAANAARAALLPLALTTRPDLLLVATEDRLHQRYRAPAMPASADLVERLRADGIAAVVSGAGPTVLALGGAPGARPLASYADPGWSVLELEPDLGGATVTTSTGPST